MRYKIEGEPLPVVTCQLEAGEELICESGGMSWMSDNMQMETTTGGGVGKMFGRLLSGESLFLNRYTCRHGTGEIAFTSSFPGSIVALDIGPGKEVVAQKSAFLAAQSTVELSVFFQKNLGSGFFGGEGFIMQKLSGHGTAFIEIDGYAKEMYLEPGQRVIVDTGYVAMMDATVSMDVQSVPGVKNMLFGGEGVFNTVLTGPGRVVLQTMPISGVASSLAPFLIKN